MQPTQPPLPRLALTLGDPAGIGPEVVLKALNDPSLAREAEVVVVGDPSLLALAAERLGLAPPRSDQVITRPALACPPEVLFSGRVSADAGRVAAAAVRLAVAEVLAGRAAAIVTAPLNKHALALAGEPFPGHTELLAAELAAPDVRMLLQGGNLRTVLCTTHLPLRDVATTLTPALVATTCRVAHEALPALGLTPPDRAPRLALAAFNPHAGEAGQFGDEETRILQPALDLARATTPKIELTGPHPADTLFAQANRPDSGIDAVIALYHDQGLIPVKLAAFGGATNVTLGLPIVRTSPDHGTAFDIVGQNRADPSSLREALRLAARMATARFLPSSSHQD